eukprot:TRINITY_DN7999_c0_g1_i1.p1 TRINITY_DN7999_c0_g1~~TRINITY_DN7999_c0_g1_i1.p1  ORF type:complete len:248 (-),score=45.07 TRINITY_DN7999_c0_g1_i1:460-1203(-)
MEKIIIMVMMMVWCVESTEWEICGNTGENYAYVPHLFGSRGNQTQLLFDPPQMFITENVTSQYHGQYALNNYTICAPMNIQPLRELVFYSWVTYIADYSCLIIDPESVQDLFSSDINLSIGRYSEAGDCGCSVPKLSAGEYITGITVTLYASPTWSTYHLHGCDVAITKSTIKPQRGELFAQKLSLGNTNRFVGFPAGLLEALVGVSIAAVVLIISTVALYLYVRRKNNGYQFVAIEMEHKDIQIAT